MAARGAYKKGVAKRREILDASLEIVDRHGYSNATVKELAEAVGLSQNGLLHYFGSKVELFTEIVRHSGELGLVDAATRETGDLRTALIQMHEYGERIPGFLQLYLRLCAEATEADHPSHEFFRDRFETQRSLLKPAYAGLKASGDLRPDADPDLLASMTFSLIDGLQTQRMFKPDLDVPAHIAHFLALLAPCGEAESAPVG